MIEPVYTDRGFAHLDSVICRDGDLIKVYESSLATEPAVWLQVIENGTPTGEEDVRVVAHCSLDDIRRLMERLQWMLDNHYQVQ